MNGGLVLQTGLPFTIQNAAARSNTGIGNDRPNRIASGVLPSDQRGVAGYFDTSAFVAQPLFTIGNESRTPLYGPGAKNLDLSVGKDFRIKERYALQFKSEFFNLSNTPNFGLPQVNLGAADFGTINNTANYTSLQIQFSLRLLF